MQLTYVNKILSYVHTNLLEIAFSKTRSLKVTIFSQENFVSLRVLLIIKNKLLDQHVFFKGRIASALVDSAALCSVSTGV